MTFDPSPTNLAGLTCLITGANGGIGQATAEHFAALGCRVLATDLSQEYGGDCETTYKPFDLLSHQQLEACCEWISREKPDILFNNAALFGIGSILDTDTKQYDTLFGLNVRAMYVVMQAVAKSLVENKQKGSIINLASQAGHRGEALVAHYCATKAAVISYTQSAALALAPYRIRVNAISPGVIDTPMWDTVDALFARFENKKPGQKKKEVGDAVPLGYMGEPRDVARVAVFLASDQSEYITAQTINVDGGSVLR